MSISHLIPFAVEAAERAAIASYPWIGRGQSNAADAAAVDAMRAALNEAPISGTVVIGEGERDEAPMLYIGEKVGLGGPAIDIALDPLEGTALTAEGKNDALTVLAFATAGGFLHAPDVYMEKIAVGGGLPQGVVHIDATPAENLKALAKAKNRAIKDLCVCILDRSRHEKVIEQVRSAGAKIKLIQDGDVGGVIATSDPESGIDLYIGSGGAPEGVLAAAALRAIGGQMQGKLLFHKDIERERATKIGITDFNRIYDLMDLASGDVLLVASGVTNGTLVNGVVIGNGYSVTQTLVMDSRHKRVQKIETKRLA